MTETIEAPCPKARIASNKSNGKKALAGTTLTADAKPPAKPVARKAAPKKAADPTAKARRKVKTMSAEERNHLIAEAAYLRAEQRGFSGGDPVQDWIEAEADLDARLGGTAKKAV